MNFLPQDYVAPKSSSFYMKLQEGENRIRILTQPVLGWEDWDEKRPVRFKLDAKPVKPLDMKKPVRHFWAFVVFNYNEEQIQVLHITQATIRKSIQDLCNDKDWGAPYNYDIKIKKTGEGKDTEYSVNPVPHKTIDPYLLSSFKDRPCNLEALFTNEDPFASHWDKYTQLGVDATVATEYKPSQNKITFEQAKDLVKIISDCDPKYSEKVLTALKKEGVGTLFEVSKDTYAKLYPAAIKNRDNYQKEKEVPFLLPLEQGEVAFA